jgi:hypothetical protein
MFKKEINFITDLNLTKIQILGDRFTIEDLKKSDIHPAIYRYITAYIDSEIFLDRKKIEADSIFNYNNERVKNYFNLISHEIKRTQNFDFEYIKRLLQDSIVFNIHFLINPNNTLLNSLFGDAEIKTVDEIILKISQVYYYRYLQKILLTYLDKKQVILMRKDEFNELLLKIDEISRETHLDNTLSTVVNSMANFFDPNSKSSQKIPLIAIQQYLDEKKLFEYSDRLFERFGDDSKTSLFSGDLIEALRSVTPVSEMVVENKPHIDDQLVIDDSQENIIAEEVEPSESEIIEIDQGEAANSDELFEVTEDEDEIPNNEILSNENITLDESISQLDETFENKSSDHDKTMPLDDEIEEEEQSKNDIIEDDEDSVKKKPDVVNIIDDLIDTNNIYDKLHSDLIPFDDNNSPEILTTSLDDSSDELSYKIDVSNLKEDISIDENILDSNNPEYSKSLENEKMIGGIEKESDTGDNNEIDAEIRIESKSIFENDNSIDKSDIIDEIPKDDNYDSDADEEQDMNNLIDDSKLVLSEEDDEELTEVFTDLMYLGGSENGETIDELKDDSIDSQTIESQTSEDEAENQSVDQSEFVGNFSETLVSKDMTKIIETIFDYDMEDYHSIIDRISHSKSESDAYEITDEYCKSNNIEKTSIEVDTFKSLISEFFSKAYS